MPIVVPTIDLSNQPILTSGSVGATVIDTILVVEHAARRCGKTPSTLSAENLDTARTNLHFILSALSNRGINLWAVDQCDLSLQTGKATYPLPVGTESILNAVYRTVSRSTGTAVLSGFDNCSTTFQDQIKIQSVGFKLNVALTTTFVLDYSLDGTTWIQCALYEDTVLAAGWHWYTLDPAVVCKAFRVRDTVNTTFTVTDMICASDSRDIPIQPMNRDTYTGLPNKTSPGRPNSYFFDKLIVSELVLHPVPTDDTGQVLLYRQRRIQDVGGLAEKLEIPERWFESIIWSLAKNLAFELDGVDPTRITLCIQQAQAALEDAELGESDQAPMFIVPNIRGYTA